MVTKSTITALFHKFVNRETIAYIVVGAFTTVINFISYESLYRIGLDNLTANALAWVISVIFAYITNKKHVFLSESRNMTDDIIKLLKFFGARIVTLVIEQAGIFIFIEKLNIYRWLVKGGLAVIVIVLNYLFSKLFIFKKNQDKLKKETGKA